jgi:hypothetical protein
MEAREFQSTSTVPTVLLPIVLTAAVGGLVLRFGQERSKALKILLMYELFNEPVHMSLPV